MYRSLSSLKMNNLNLNIYGLYIRLIIRGWLRFIYKLENKNHVCVFTKCLCLKRKEWAIIRERKDSDKITKWTLLFSIYVRI